MDASAKKRARRETWGTLESSMMAKNTHNPIRKLVDGMKLTPNPDKEMIALSIGDPAVFGNLPPSEIMSEAVCEVTRANKSNGYAPSIGYEQARAAVAEAFTCDEAPITSKEVIFASGCSGALDLAISCLANPGQNILIPRPGFSLYKTLADSLGINCKHYNLIPERQWEIDTEQMESLLDDNTACIIVNNPSNPCGSVFTRKHIKEILDVADRNKIPVIADEIYAHFVFPGNEYMSMASQTTQVPIISCGGLTKRYLVPGWRMGWLTIHDRHGAFEKEIKPGLINLSQRILGPNTIIQGALKKILTETPQHFFDTTLHSIKKNADIMYDCMTHIPGLNPIMPQGAMYMMVGIDIAKFPSFKNDVQFTEQMVTEQSVFCLPAEYPNYFRVVLTVPTEKIEEACHRIKEFCAAYYCEHSEKNGSA